jgi:DNA-binding winged helix-turn-helix (wHTH) protein
MAIALHEPTRELIKGNTRIRLQEQPFQIMRMLLARPGALVTRDEMRSRLWPDGTFVDFEHSLNAAVKRLRAALGDDARAPRYIETLPRRGYRWIHTAIPLDTRSNATAHVPHREERIEIVWT